MPLLAAALLAPCIVVPVASDPDGAIHPVDFQAIVNREAKRMVQEEVSLPRQSPQPAKTRWRDRHPIIHGAVQGACIGSLIATGAAFVIVLANGEGPGLLGIAAVATFGGGIGAVLGAFGK